MTILLVDDSPTQRAIWLYALSNAGLKVSAFDSVEAASRANPDRSQTRLILLKSPLSALDFLRETEVDLLITDVEMPEMSGWDLALRAELKQPQLRVLIVSSKVQTGQVAPLGLDRSRTSIVAKSDRSEVLSAAQRMLTRHAA